MVAAAVVAGAVGSAAIGAVASSSAAGEQASAARTAANEQLSASELASQTQLDMFHEAENKLSPYVTTGNNALAQLASLYGIGGAGGAGGSTSTPDTAAMEAALQKFPGYQFSFDQGVQALDRSAASRGLLLSGGQLKDLTTYGQGMASTQFGNYINQLQALGSLGESAASMTGNNAVTTGQGVAGSTIAGGNAVAQGILGSGQATAAGLVGGANAISGGISSGTNNALLLQALQNPNNASSFGFNPSTSNFSGTGFAPINTGGPIVPQV